MDVLMLGGTIFLGRAIVDAATERGHVVTLFHRGRHGADLFPDLEHVLGDRDGGLDALAGRTFDAVIDTCGYVPRVVGESAWALADACDHYVFVSSLSVYDVEGGTGPFDEAAPLARLEDESTEEVTAATYGGLKALCERAAEAAMPDRALVVRPGLIVGPHDPTDRFTYWPVRAARGGRMLAPAPRTNPVELTDVRDLAGWIVIAVERGLAGRFNVSGPTPEKTTIGALIDACTGAAPEPVEPVWVDEAFLLEQGVAYWSELPVCVPSRDATTGPASHASTRAIEEGLTFRPLEETVRDTLEWARGRSLSEGLTPERERGLLDAWDHRPAPSAEDALQRFENDDAGYEAWLEAHPDGFVFNFFGGSDPRLNLVHAAACRHLHRPHDDGRRTHVPKVCAPSREAIHAEATRLRGGPDRWGTCAHCGG